jgi:hypothetical protein
MVNPWCPMVRDDRARPVALYRLDLRWRRPGDQRELPGPVFACIRSRLLSITTHGMGAHPVPMLLLLAFFGYMAYFNFRRARSGWDLVWPPLVMVVIGAFSIVTYRRRIPEIDRSAIARELVAERRCASCAYDLSQTGSSEDGLTTCPECGAAWRIPDARAHGPAEPPSIDEQPCPSSR